MPSVYRLLPSYGHGPQLVRRGRRSETPKRCNAAPTFSRHLTKRTDAFISHPCAASRESFARPSYLVCLSFQERWLLGGLMPAEPLAFHTTQLGGQGGWRYSLSIKDFPKKRENLLPLQRPRVYLTWRSVSSRRVRQPSSDRERATVGSLLFWRYRVTRSHHKRRRSHEEAFNRHGNCIHGGRTSTC